MATVVISLGGSLMIKHKDVGASTVSEGLDTKYIAAIAKLLLKLSGRHRLIMACGGGAVCRQYQAAVMELGGSAFAADEAGIQTTRANAMLLAAALGDKAWPAIPTCLDSAAPALASDRILVMGGTSPGHSTDTVAALLAEKIGADRLVNISHLGPIYSADPRTSRLAHKISRLSHGQLVHMAAEHDKRRPGEHFIFDALAAKIAQRSKIELHFVSGELDQVQAAIEGRKHSGSIVR